MIKLHASFWWVLGKTNLLSSYPPMDPTWSSISTNVELYVSSLNAISLSENLNCAKYLKFSDKSFFFNLLQNPGRRICKKVLSKELVCVTQKPQTLLNPTDYLLTLLRINKLLYRYEQFDHQLFLGSRRKSVFLFH